jgi:hypothetical protein
MLPLKKRKAPVLIDHSTKQREEIGLPLNLIEADQTILMLPEVEFGISELAGIRRSFEIHIDARPGLFGDRQRQRSLAALPRPKMATAGKSCSSLLIRGWSLRWMNPCILKL